MSSNNAQNIYNIQSSSKFVNVNENSDSTSAMATLSGESITYDGDDLNYSHYFIESAEGMTRGMNSIRVEGDNMKNDDILRAYMDKVDMDQRELKKEMKEREERISQNIRESEQRMDDRLDRIESMISDQNKNYDGKIEKLSDKLDQSVIAIKSNKWQIVIAAVATVLSVAGIAFATMQVVQGILSLVK